MKFLYIDDSYLCSEPFMKTMQNRLFSFCEEKHITHIFISGHAYHAHYRKLFYDDCRRLNIKVIKSPAHFALEEYNAILSDTSLQIDQIGSFTITSGLALYGDTKKKQFQRIYFDLYLTYHLRKDSNQLEEELSELLHDILNQHKKTNQYH